MSENNLDDDLERYLSDAYSVEDLYEVLADHASLGADEANKQRAGAALFSSIWKQNKNRVCGSPAIRLYTGDPNAADFTTIAAQVLNLLIPVPGINLSLVAIIAVRIGLRQLCRTPSAPA